jgi:hypothetical protein
VGEGRRLEWQGEITMPLHDWAVLPGWEGVRQVWIVELLYWIKPRLPEGYRAYLGTTPTFAIGAPVEERPDVGVREWPANRSQAALTKLPHPQQGPAEEPDEEIAVATLQGDRALLIERRGLLIAAIELVSPRNKDRPSACTAYASGYVGYLLKGVHLMLVDVHRRPRQFSFVDRIAAELHLDQPPCPAPFALAYRVGEPAPSGGRFLGVWRRPMTIGELLPVLWLPLSVEESVSVDLEATYTRAAAAAYLG